MNDRFLMDLKCAPAFSSLKMIQSNKMKVHTDFVKGKSEFSFSTKGKTGQKNVMIDQLSSGDRVQTLGPPTGAPRNLYCLD